VTPTDLMGAWLATHNEVRIERLNGRYLATAYETRPRLLPVSWGYGSTQVEALEKLAENGQRTGHW
jgi:hypothetical protein